MKKQNFSGAYLPPGLILFLFILLIIEKANGQYYIDSVFMLPTNPINSEESKLIIKMTYDVSACSFHSNNILLNGSQYTINEYFACGGGIGITATKTDTINLGFLQADSFNAKIIMNVIINLYYQYTDTSKVDSSQINFYVSSNNGVGGSSVSNYFDCYPTLSSGVFLLIVKTFNIQLN